MRTKTGMELLLLSEVTKNSITKFTTPFICLQGTDDIHCSYEDSKNFYKNSKSLDKTFIKLEKFRNGFFYFFIF
jgi:esterase/lipase